MSRLIAFISPGARAQRPGHGPPAPRRAHSRPSGRSPALRLRRQANPVRNAMPYGAISFRKSSTSASVVHQLHTIRAERGSSSGPSSDWLKGHR